ncbi:hypothetical protein BLS_006346 [Venturia inaequalis]|uniref:Uncharacterized protein n=1 Tax=Venturia inaequalis TaxID=5025 RepID=A0A8H3UD66_VENIN|nr:hypothetical protein BLS_006346 [Venturia inaequalis]
MMKFITALSALLAFVFVKLSLNQLMLLLLVDRQEGRNVIEDRANRARVNTYSRNLTQRTKGKPSLGLDL